MKKQYKTGKTQRDAVKRYQEKNKGKQKGIGTTYNAEECDYIQAIFRAHGVKPSEVLRGAAAALLDGEPIRTEAAPLIAPQAAGEAEPAPAPVEDDGTTDGEE